MTAKKPYKYPSKSWSMILNNVRWLTANTCSSSPSGELELLLETTGKVIVMLVDPDPSSIFRFWLKPRGGKGASKYSKKPNFTYEETATGEIAEACDEGIPDVNRIISAVIPGRTVTASRVAGDLERYVWSFANAAEHALWYVLVATLAEDWLFDYTSGVVRLPVCETCYKYSGSTLLAGGSSYDSWLSQSNATPAGGRDWYWQDTTLIPRTPGAYRGDWFACTQVRNVSDKSQDGFAWFTVNDITQEEDFTLKPGETFTHIWHVQGVVDDAKCQLLTGARGDKGLLAEGNVGIQFCANPFGR